MTIKWLGILFLILTASIAVHHYGVASTFFNIHDILHHEFFMALVGGFGLGLLFASFVGDRERKKTIKA